MKDNTKAFINEKIIPLFSRIAGSRHLLALRDGMATAVPMIVIGSIFMLIAQFPIKGYQNFMTQTFGANWATIVQYPTNASFHIMGLIAVAGISYNLARSYKIDAFSAMIVGIGAFILTIPMKVDSKGALWVPLKELDSSGLFIALIVGLFITDLYVWLVHKNITIKMPDTVPPAVSNSFASLIPGAIVLVLVWLVRIGVEATPMKSIPDVVTFFLQAPLGHLTNTLGGALVMEFFVSVLWLFGIHGSNTIDGITSPMLLAALAQNASAQAAGKPLPNIVTKQFFDIFIRIGGCGATLGLAIMIAFLSRSKEYKVLGQLVIGPAIFNINEPIAFGLPTVLNYKMAIPYILAPLCNVAMTYMSMKTGLVARTFGVMVPWTTPPLLSGYLSTGHISGAILQLVEIIVDGLIYYFFFKSMDNEKVKEEKLVLETEA